MVDDLASESRTKKSPLRLAIAAVCVNLVFCSLTTSAADVPQNALGCVSINVQQLRTLANWQSLRALAARVLPETRRAYLHQVGVDLTEIQRLTLIIPDADKGWLALAQLPQATSEIEIDDALSQDNSLRWSRRSLGVWRVWIRKDHDFCVAQAAPKLIAFGSSDAVDWYGRATQRSKATHQMSLATDLYAQWNLTHLPETTFQATPLLYPLAQATRATLHASLGPSGAIEANIQFANDEDARAGYDTLRLTCAMCRGFLLAMEKRAMAAVDEAQSPTDAVQPLAMLSAMRHFSRLIRDLDIRQEDDQVTIRSDVALDGTLLLSGLLLVSEIATNSTRRGSEVRVPKFGAASP